MYVIIIIIIVFRDRFSLYSPGCPPASASQVLELKACAAAATTTQHVLIIIAFKVFIYVYGCIACIYVCASCPCLVPKEARRKFQVRGMLVMTVMLMELNLGPLEEKLMLLTKGNF